eukprot:759462-Hanusia_phi.AAC.5
MDERAAVRNLIMMMSMLRDSLIVVKWRKLCPLVLVLVGGTKGGGKGGGGLLVVEYFPVGCSTGALVPSEGSGIFKGILSTRNNGGFSSIRSPQTNLDLSDADGILINCKGDGRIYKLQARSVVTFSSCVTACKVCSDARAPGVKYQAEFLPSTEWNEHAVLWSDLKPSLRGVLLEGAPEISKGEISSFGILTSKVTSYGEVNSKFQPGEFSLAIRSISAFQLE